MHNLGITRGLPRDRRVGRAVDAAADRLGTRSTTCGPRSWPGCSIPTERPNSDCSGRVGAILRGFPAEPSFIRPSRFACSLSERSEPIPASEALVIARNP